MILNMSVVTMVYFSACALSSLFVNHYVTPMFSPQDLNFKFQFEQAEQVDFIL